MTNTEINAQELSSRKLWQLAQTTSENAISKQQLSEVVAELAKRRHNLEKLQEIGKLGDQYTD
ncbi:MAG: hypothetical protein P8J17_13820 [Halioglobus sp.]|nr:hypothetical protein [Halioglobus sp.]